MHADDMNLVREFALTGSDTAFATLVERHLNLVYSVALRRLGNPHEAEEVAQVVFIILARKAGSLRHGTVLSGWLYQAAQLTAANFQRAKIRRQHREQEAFMQFTQESESQAWPQLSPFLEDAMSRLRQKERDAIVLRFFENRTVAEVALALGLGEAAAQKRLNRATDKLKKFFASRGVQVSTHGMLHSIGSHAVQIAPAGLASSIATVAATKGVVAGGSTLTLMKGALKIMAWTKAKTAIVTGAVILLAAGTTTVVVTKIAARPPRFANLSAADLSWADNPKYWATDSRVLEKLPAGIFIFRPTKFPDSGGGVWANGRMSLKNGTVSDLMDQAYGFSYERTVLPADMPTDHYDVLATVPNGNDLIKKELQKRYSLAARVETWQTNVLLLEIQNSNPPNLKPHTSRDGASSWAGSDHKTTIQNEELTFFFNNIESYMGVPVRNKTGLKGRYDLQLDWKRRPGESEKDAYQRALSEQLGLELVPGQEPIKMLVVDKNNSL
jgi:uncharacterized protein (TIGR03435 family)